MATRTVVTMIDDLSGKEGEDVAPREFAVGGVLYEIDLSDANWAAFEKAVSKFVFKSRKVKRPASVTPIRARRAVNGGRSQSEQERREAAANARLYARSQGHDVPSRGRVPQKFVELWEAAGRPVMEEPEEQEQAG